MKNSIQRLIIASMTSMLLSTNVHTQTAQPPRDISTALAETLGRKDNMIFEDALTSCNIGEMAGMLTDDFQFFQDDGGPQYSTRIDRQEFLNHTKRFCESNSHSAERKVRRVVEGSLQVYPLNDYGAIQFGIQHFYSVKAGIPDQLVEVSRFTNTWRYQNRDWKLSKEFISQEAIHSTQLENQLYDTIARLDSVLFTAINNRDLATVKDMYSKDLEFYHDKGGLMNYETNMRINEENFAKTDESVRREIDKASLEVYPIKGFGAIEIGTHKFYTTVKGQPEKLTASPKFILIWREQDGKWQVVRAISYGH